MVIYYALIICANLKIVIFSNTFSPFVVLVLLFSVVCYPVSYWLMSSWDYVDIYGLYKQTTSHFLFYTTLFVTVCVVAIADWAITKFLGKVLIIQTQ